MSMLDIKLIREDVETVIKRLETRGGDYNYLRTVYQLDEERRKLLTKVETLKNERNEKSRLIGIMKREKQDTSEIMASVGTIGEVIRYWKTK